MNRYRSFPTSPRYRSTAQARVIVKGRETPRANWAVFTMATLAGAAALAITFLSGCNTGPKPFAKVNGQVVSQDEYIHQLERQTVNVPGGQATNAERVVIDQIISNRVIMSEASKNNVLPSDEDVNNLYEVQKKLFEAQVPGKDYETTMKEQGIGTDETKGDLRVQLAETNLYAKMLKLDESEVRSTYDKFRAQFGLPPRVQMRLIVAPAKSAELTQIQQALASGKSFDTVAKEMNPPQLRGTGGLVPQATPVTQLAPAIQAKITATPEGKFFGPIDFQQGIKAWVKLEKKLPEFKIPFEDAAPLVRRQLVQMKLNDPKNQQFRNDILKKKMQATFQPEDKSYDTVWSAVKDAASKAGVGQSAPAAGAAAPAPVMPGAK